MPAKIASAALHRIDAVEDRLLVLLHVAIVGHRQPFQRGEQRDADCQRRGPFCRGSAPRHPGSFSAASSERAGGVGVADRDELQTRSRPTGSRPRSAAKGASRRARARRAVPRRNRGRSRHPCEFWVIAGKSSSRATSSRSSGIVEPAIAPLPSGMHIDPPPRVGDARRIALEHLHISEQMVRKEDRLRALQMRVAGDDDRRDCASRASTRARCISRSSSREFIALARADRGADRARPDRCGCARCAASRPRRRSAASAPPRCSCGCLRARA